MGQENFHQRVAELDTWYTAKTDALSDDAGTIESPDDLARLDGYTTEATRVLREVNVSLLRREEEISTRLAELRHQKSKRWAPPVDDNEIIELRRERSTYVQLKADIDRLLRSLTSTKTKLNSTRLPVVIDHEDDVIDLTDRLVTLAELHRLGALTDDEFGAAKSRLL